MSDLSDGLLSGHRADFTSGPSSPVNKTMAWITRFSFMVGIRPLTVFCYPAVFPKPTRRLVFVQIDSFRISIDFPTIVGLITPMVHFQEKKSTKSTKKAKVAKVPGPSGEQPTPSTSGEHLPSSPSGGATSPSPGGDTSLSPGGDTSPAKSQQGALPTTPLSPEQKDLIAEKQLSAKLKLTTKNTEGLVTDFGLTWFKALQAEFTKPYFLQVDGTNIAHIRVSTAQGKQGKWPKNNSLSEKT